MKRTIAGKDYQFKDKEIPIGELRFWPENPRIYAKLHSLYNDKPPDLTDSHLQEKIYDYLRGTAERSSIVSELSEQIERSGLTEPLIVRKDSKSNFYSVLEGNRRLAACRMILEKAKDKNRTDLIERFSSLSCEITPKDFPDSHVFSLLGTLHISGKLPWDPFAKASYVKRRVEVIKKEGASEDAAVERVAEELGERKRGIETIIANINLMEYTNETETTKYSFYDILNRNRVTHNDIKENKTLKKRWVDSIFKWHGKAVEYRSAIQAITKDPKALEKFREGELDLKSATQQTEDHEDTDVIYRRVKRFHISMANAKPRLMNTKSTDRTLQKLKSELAGLEMLIGDIKKILGEQND